TVARRSDGDVEAGNLTQKIGDKSAVAPRIPKLVVHQVEDELFSQ
ncbi:unnamed protein product, partial [Mesorhabditis spiculigera]